MTIEKAVRILIDNYRRAGEFHKLEGFEDFDETESIAFAAWMLSDECRKEKNNAKEDS